MQEDISLLIAKLNWNDDITSQQHAIEQLMHIDDKYVTLLIQPIGKKYWENAAKILKAIGYPRNRLAIYGLLEWLKDLNWPGALIAMETLQNIETSVLLPYLETAILKAIEENDEMWIMALKELVINRLALKISNFKKQELYKILKDFE